MASIDSDQDTSFDLNLAPFLDIIVSIVPLLLLVVAFSTTKIIETPVPLVVEKAIQELNKKPQAEVILRVGNGNKLSFVTKSNGSEKFHAVALSKEPTQIMDNLYAKALEIKRQFPEVFNVSVEPDSDVELNSIIGAIDVVRKLRTGEEQFKFKDPATGDFLSTDLMFPKITFSNVIEE